MEHLSTCLEANICIKLHSEGQGKATTSICRRVFATSRGHVAAAARLPATKAAEKFAPKTLKALGSSPTKLRSLLLIYINRKKNLPFLSKIYSI
jgi:hypothetical protein